jgi:carbonic anhydrase
VQIPARDPANAGASDPTNDEPNDRRIGLSRVARARHSCAVSPADELRANARIYAATHFEGPRPIQPARHLAVVACMDSRMDIFGLLGLHSGDAHIIRNAGGVVTDDVIRSLVLSQRLLGTTGIVLVHHTDCGLQKVSEDDMRAELERETGMRPSFSFEAFSDPFTNVRQSIARLHLNPFLASKRDITGFVYNVETGELHDVEAN